MSRLLVKALGTILLWAMIVGNASAQRYIGFTGAGSTVQGDILRGEGVMLYGAGMYNYYSAIGNSINVNTMMRLNEYIYQSLKLENHEKALHRAAVLEKKRENYEKILDRVKNNPEELDILKGSALNSIRETLASPRISESEMTANAVPLSAETVRAIPFFFAERNAVISLRRLSVRGRWPVGLRGNDFSTQRRAYERALDEAMEQQLDAKLSRESIAKVDSAITNLSDRLDQVIPPSNDRIYLDAKNCLTALSIAKNQLKDNKVEQILGAINKYSGTTVQEFLVFMQKYNLRFHIPEIGDEREMYPKLYAAFKQQLDSLSYQK